MDFAAYSYAQLMSLKGEFSSKLIPNFQTDRWFLTKCPMLVVNEQRLANRPSRRAIRTSAFLVRETSFTVEVPGTLFELISVLLS